MLDTDPIRFNRAICNAIDDLAAPARAVAALAGQITVPMRAVLDACRVNPPSLHIPEKLSK